MDSILPVVIGIGILARVLRAAHADERPATLKPVEYPLCPHCANAHIVRKAGSEALVTFCDRNSAHERIQEEVVACSSFRPAERVLEGGRVHVCGFACAGCARD